MHQIEKLQGAMPLLYLRELTCWSIWCSFYLTLELLEGDLGCEAALPWGLARARGWGWLGPSSVRRKLWYWNPGTGHSGHRPHLALLCVTYKPVFQIATALLTDLSTQTPNQVLSSS